MIRSKLVWSPASPGRAATSDAGDRASGYWSLQLGTEVAEHAAVGLALSIERGFPHHIAQNTTVIHGKALPHRTAFAASSR